MIKSMTGYGRAESDAEGRGILVEIKSVNHRYFEFSSRTTRGYNFLDEKLKSYVQSKVSRGKVDVFVTIEALEDAAAEVKINHSLADGYVKALRELRDTYGLQDDISVSTVARYGDIFSIHKGEEDEDQVWEQVRSVLDRALEKFIQMRSVEGERLKSDIESRAQTILAIVEKVEELKLIKDRYPILGMPLIRGTVNFLAAMVSGVKALMYSADFYPEEEESQPSKFEQWLEKHLSSEKLEKAIVGLAVLLAASALL